MLRRILAGVIKKTRAGGGPSLWSGFFAAGGFTGVPIPVSDSAAAQSRRRRQMAEKAWLQRQLLLLLLAVAAVAVFISMQQAHGRERRKSPAVSSSDSSATTKPSDERDEQGRRVVYKQKNVVDFDAMLLEGDLKNPNEFYFVHRPEEKFGSLVKKRKDFHKEMLRDSVMIR